MAKSGRIEGTLAAPRDEYARRVARWEERLQQGERRHVLISNLRLITAVGIALAAWLAFFRASAPIVVFIVPGLVFLALMVVHAVVLQNNERSARAKRLYVRGIERLDGKWAGVGPDGERFGADHPFARDLDLFGHASLFQLLSTARTEAGEATLADWLGGPASVTEIRARQQAIQELRSRLDFREDLAVLAAEAHVGRTSGLAEWAAAGSLGLPTWAGAVFAALAIGTATLIVLTYMGLAPIGLLFGWLVVQIATVGVRRRSIDEVIRRIEGPSLDIRLLTALLARIEREPFESPRLAAVHARLVVGDVLPSTRMRQLRTRVEWLESMHNPLFAPFGAALLVRAQSAVWIDRWHAKNGRLLVEWLEAVGELEALGSFAALAFERPDHPFPTLLEDSGRKPLLDAKGLTHPLIAHGAVANDVRLGRDAPHVLFVSGSNMSGKSTLLRAVGCNVVLALAGAPVSAAEMTLTPLAIGATLRVEDSLQAGISRFYAEVLRLRTIVDTAKGPLPLVFLLDEMLAGTNSHDRRIGAEAVVRSLVDTGAIGLVTTHDLALTELAKTLGERATNVHFADHLEDGRMVFDYKMHPGVVTHSNALALMKAIGLEVDDRR